MASPSRHSCQFTPTGYIGAFCVYTEVLKAKNQDLTNPVYKGDGCTPTDELASERRPYPVFEQHAHHSREVAED